MGRVSCNTLEVFMLRPNQSISVVDVLGMLWRRRWRSAFLFVLVMALAAGGIFMMPRKYESEAVLFVHLGRESIGFDPAANTGQPIALNYTRDGEIVSVLSLIQSRVVYERAVDQVGADEVLEVNVAQTPIEQWIDAAMKFLPAEDSELERQYQREKAIRHLLEAVEINNPKKSHVITVTYKARTPELSQKVLQAFVDSAVKYHLESHHSPNSYEFLEKQAAELAEDVISVKEQLRDAKNAVGVGSVTSQRAVLEDRLREFNKELLQLETMLAASQDRASSLRKLLPAEMRDSEATSGNTAKAVDDMRNELYRLQLRERELVAKYKPDHPSVVVVREQLKTATEDLNRHELAIEVTSTNSYRSRLESLQRSYASAAQELKKLNEDEVSILELERKVDHLQETHHIAQKNLATARMNEAMEKDRITNVVVAQDPTFMGKPLSRHGALIMAASLVVALLGATGLAYVSEMSDDRLKRAEDIEDVAGLPVMASVPKVRSPRVSLT